MRTKYIQSLESLRDSTVIVLVSGIYEDVLEPLARHLEAVEEPERLSLFLRTRGGDTTAAFNIVNLIKQYFKEFEIIIPSICHSAGTLLSLGASQLVMTRQGSLSPFDPSVRNDRINDGMNISWRDMNYFTSSASKDFRFTNTETPLSLLIENQVHPLLIGHAERTVAQIRELAPLLLGSNCSRPPEDIVEFFLEPNRHHNYRVYRDEATKAGLHVIAPDKGEGQLILAIFDDIAKELDLLNQSEKRGKVKACIQSLQYGKTVCIHTEEYEGWVDEKETFEKARLTS